jgi:hypothetical protein
VKTFTVVDWISLVITEHAFIFFYRIRTRCLNISRSDLLNEYNRLLSADFEGYPGIRPSTRIGPTQYRGTIGFSSRYLESRFKSRSRLGLMFDMAVHAGK